MEKVKEGIVFRNKSISKLIFDTISELMLLLGTNGEVLAANTIFVEFFGVKESEMLNKKLWEQEFIEKERENILKESVEKVKNGQKVKYETENNYKGKQSFLEISMKPIFDEENGVIAILVEVYDITEIKKMEFEFEKYHKESMIINKELLEEKEKIANALSLVSLKASVMNNQLLEEKRN